MLKSDLISLLEEIPPTPFAKGGKFSSLSQMEVGRDFKV